MFSKSIPVTGYKNLLGEAPLLSPPKPTGTGCSTRGDPRTRTKGDDLLGSCCFFHPEWLNTSSCRNAARPKARGAPRQKAMEHKEVLKTEKTAKCGICTTGTCLQNPTWTPCLGFGCPRTKAYHVLKGEGDLLPKFLYALEFSSYNLHWRIFGRSSLS